MSTKRPLPQYLSLQEVAERFGVTDRTVRRWISDGRLRAYRVGGHLVRVDTADLDRLAVPTGGAV